MSTLKSAPRKLVALKDLKPNLWRDLETNPLNPERVTAIAKSIEVNGWWGNIHVRPAPNGKGYEVAYGWHRVTAISKANGPNTEVEVMVQNLSDGEMLRFMADENLEGAGGDALTDIQLIAGVITAYGEGRIDLPAVPAGTDPKFIKMTGGSRPPVRYTAVTVAQFLGWGYPRSGRNSIEATDRCQTAFTAWHLIQDGLIDLAMLKAMKKEYGRLNTKDVETAIKAAKNAVVVNKEFIAKMENDAKDAEANGEKKIAAKYRAKAKEATEDKTETARAAASDAVARTLDPIRIAVETSKIVKASVKRTTKRKNTPAPSLFNEVNTLIEELKKVKGTDQFSVRLGKLLKMSDAIQPAQLPRLQAAISAAAENSEAMWSEREKTWARPFTMKTVTPPTRKALMPARTA